jgi:hypothetical protein
MEQIVNDDRYREQPQPQLLQSQPQPQLPQSQPQQPIRPETHNLLSTSAPVRRNEVPLSSFPQQQQLQRTSAELRYKPPKYYLHKMFRGGSLLLEIGFSPNRSYVYSNIYASLWAKESSPSSSSNRGPSGTNSSSSSSSSSSKLKPLKLRLCADEMTKFQQSLHFSSFAYDFHIRTLQKALRAMILFSKERNSPIELPLEVLTQSFSSILDFYPSNPNYARNNLLQVTLFLPTQTDKAVTPLELLDFIAQHSDQYGLFKVQPPVTKPKYFKDGGLGPVLLLQHPSPSPHLDESNHILTLLRMDPTAQSQEVDQLILNIFILRSDLLAVSPLSRPDTKLPFVSSSALSSTTTLVTETMRQTLEELKERLKETGWSCFLHLFFPLLYAHINLSSLLFSPLVETAYARAYNDLVWKKLISIDPRESMSINTLEELESAKKTSISSRSIVEFDPSLKSLLEAPINYVQFANHLGRIFKGQIKWIKNNSLTPPSTPSSSFNTGNSFVSLLSLSPALAPSSSSSSTAFVSGSQALSSGLGSLLLGTAGSSGFSSTHLPGADQHILLLEPTKSVFLHVVLPSPASFNRPSVYVCECVKSSPLTSDQQQDDEEFEKQKRKATSSFLSQFVNSMCFFLYRRLHV